MAAVTLFELHSEHKLMRYESGQERRGQRLERRIEARHRSHALQGEGQTPTAWSWPGEPDAKGEERCELEREPVQPQRPAG